MGYFQYQWFPPSTQFWVQNAPLERRWRFRCRWPLPNRTWRGAHEILRSMIGLTVFDVVKCHKHVWTCFVFFKVSVNAYQCLIFIAICVESCKLCKFADISQDQHEQSKCHNYLKMVENSKLTVPLQSYRNLPGNVLDPWRLANTGHVCCTRRSYPAPRPLLVRFLLNMATSAYTALGTMGPDDWAQQWNDGLWQPPFHQAQPL